MCYEELHEIDTGHALRGDQVIEAQPVRAVRLSH